MLNEYMSDDGFLDFRMWLIFRGKDVYMAALKNPDSLAELKLPTNIQETMGTRYESYGCMANRAYEQTGDEIDFYKMMDEIHPMSDEEKANLRADLKCFPQKVSDQDEAKRFLPSLYAKYITPETDFQFTYRTDEDEAIELLGDGPESLKETALRLLFRAKETICCRSEYIGVTGQLRQDLTALQYAVTDVLDDAMRQVRDIGLDEYADDEMIQTEMKPSTTLVPAAGFRVKSEIFPEEMDVVGYFCPNPKCPCKDASLYFYKADGAFKEKLFKIVLNHETWQLVSTEIFDQDEAYPKVIQEFMESPSHELRSTLLSGKKTAVTANRDTLQDDIDYSGLEIDTMVCYTDIYDVPSYDTWVFEHGNTQYLVLDYYCPNPKCDCMETLLAFLVIKNNKAMDAPVLEIWVDLKTGKRTERTRSKGITAQVSDELYAKFEELLGGRSTMPLVERYHRIKKWSKEHLIPRLSDTQAPIKRQKVGRNDPCPCGSGKKYKKCCGA